jgi:hypothetical protein
MAYHDTVQYFDSRYVGQRFKDTPQCDEKDQDQSTTLHRDVPAAVLTLIAKDGPSEIRLTFLQPHA